MGASVAALSHTFCEDIFFKIEGYEGGLSRMNCMYWSNTTLFDVTGIYIYIEFTA